MGLSVCFEPLICHPFLVCFVYIIKNELIGQSLPKIHNSDILFREKLYREEGIDIDKRKRESKIYVFPTFFVQIFSKGIP